MHDGANNFKVPYKRVPTAFNISSELNFSPDCTLVCTMRPQGMLLIFFLSIVLSISAAPLHDDPINERLDDTLITATETPELNSTPNFVLPDLNVGDITIYRPTIPPDSLAIIIPPSTTTSSSIIAQHQNISLGGEYEFGYKTSNGIEVEEKGGQKEFVGADGEKVAGTVSSGKYSYIIVDSDGKMKRMTVTWTADENGFRPVITFSDEFKLKIANP